MPQRHLVRLVAVAPRDADRPRVSGVDHDIHHLQRDRQQNNQFFDNFFNFCTSVLKSKY